MATVAPFDYVSLGADADAIIQAAGMKCSLRRGGVDRDCWAVVYKYSPRDAATALANPTARNVIIAAGLGAVPTTPPDYEQDVLVTYVQPPSSPPVINEVLVFAQPIEQVNPAGRVLAYLSVVKR